MAAAISLKRQPKNLTTRRLNEYFSKDVKLIYDLWTGDLNEESREVLKALVTKSRDLGARAFATLALGDLAATASVIGDQAQADEILAFLGTQLLHPKTAQPVRWALADALAMSDSMLVSEQVIVPYIMQERPAQCADPATWLSRDKTMAYLIGLLRDQSAVTHRYLITHCLQQASDPKLWYTALTALGSVATDRSKQFLQEVASGNIDMTPIVEEGEPVQRQGESLRGRFSDNPKKARKLQRTAIQLLSVYHDWTMIDKLFDSSLLVEDDKLVDVLFDIAPTAYWKMASTDRR